MLTSRVVVLDFETTGRCRSIDRITEVAAVRIDGARVTERFVTLANSGRSIPPDVVELTGITNEMLAGAPPAHKVVRALADFIGSDLVVAHNASFDLSFLHAECARIGLRREFESLCTMRLARRVVPGLSSYSLPNIASRLGLAYSGRAHRAEADALLAADLLLLLARSVAAKHSVEEIDPMLLQRVTKWSIASAHDRLGRLLRRPVPAASTTTKRPSPRSSSIAMPSPRTTASTIVATRQAEASLRWKLYASGNLRDMENGDLYPRSKIRYREDPTPVLVVMHTVGTSFTVPTYEVAGFRVENLAPKAKRTCAPHTVNLEPRSYSGRRWKFDARGVLHDKEYGYRYTPGTYVYVSGPGLGVVVDQPGIGSRVIDTMDIENCEFAQPAERPK